MENLYKWSKILKRIRLSIQKSGLKHSHVIKIEKCLSFVTGLIALSAKVTKIVNQIIKEIDMITELIYEEDINSRFRRLTSTRAMDIVISLEGFHLTQNIFLVKELGYFVPSDDSFGRLTFQPPSGLWVTISDEMVDRVHQDSANNHMWWTYGVIPNDQMKPVIRGLCAPFQNVLIKSSEEWRFLAQMLESERLRIFNAPRVDILTANTIKYCPLPSHTANFGRCAVVKAIKYGRFIQENGVIGTPIDEADPRWWALR